MSNKFLIIGVIIVIALMIFDNFVIKPFNDSHAAGQATSSGENSIGGHFTLTNQDGVEQNTAQIKTPLQMIFFGFTNCPEVCPTGLNTMSLALNELGDSAKDITPIFITIDPERDTPEKIKTYLSSFHESFIGFTGKNEDIRALEKLYKIYASKRDNPEASGYTIDHSSYIYLLDSNFKYLAHFRYTDDVAKIIAAIGKFL